MFELVNFGETETQAVSVRELVDKLEIKTSLKDWFPRQIEKYGFVDGEDFSSVLSESTGGRPSKDFIVPLDIAKELCMIANTEKGKEMRRYFIEMEKKSKEISKPALPRSYKEALLELIEKEEEKDQLLLENKELEKTKSYISDRKTATAMNTASQKSKQCTKLQERLDESNSYSSIMKQEKIHSMKFPWQPLKKYCTNNQLETKKADHPVYDTVKTYPAESWYECFNIEI